MTEHERIIREAEQYLSSFTTSDLVYRDSLTIGGSLDPGEYVTVATWGREDELGQEDPPEAWPLRVRVRSEDGDEASAYLTVSEGKELARALLDAVRRARTFPQPDEAASR